MLVSTSTRSPKVYGNGGPFDIAEATADLKNSMVGGYRVSQSEEQEMFPPNCLVHFILADDLAFSPTVVSVGLMRPLAGWWWGEVATRFLPFWHHDRSSYSLVLIMKLLSCMKTIKTMTQRISELNISQ